MNKLIIADEPMRAELGKADEPAMIYTADGTVPGYFTPTLPLKLKLHSQISAEELWRREDDTTCKRFTTEEVITKLRSL